MLIELTEANRGDVPAEVTHLVEVFPKVGDVAPEFWTRWADSREWTRFPVPGAVVTPGDLYHRRRFARRHTASDLTAEIPAEADGVPVTEDEAVLESFGFSKVYSDEASSDWSVTEGLEVRVRFIAATSICKATVAWAIGKEAVPFHNKPKTWADVRRLLVGLNFSSLKAALAAAGKGL